MSEDVSIGVVRRDSQERQTNNAERNTTVEATPSLWITVEGGMFMNALLLFEETLLQMWIYL